MKKSLLISFLCVLVALMTLTGCKKDENKADDKAAPAAEAKADEAKPADAKADDAKPADAKADDAKADEAKADDAAKGSEDVKKAAQDVIGFFDGLEKVAVDAGDDCAKLGADMSAYLDKNKEQFIASMKVVGNISDDSPEAESLKDELEKLEKATSDDAAHSKAIEKCKDTKEVEAFGIAFVAALMAASPESDKADDKAAPADEAEAAAADENGK